MGAVGAKLLYPDGTVQHGGGSRDWGQNGWGHRDLHQKECSTPRRTQMDFVTGALFGVRRRDFFQVGCFTEQYDCYCEDADLGVKLHNIGRRMYFEPGAHGVHVEAQSTSSQREAMLIESQELFARRWGGWFSHREGRIL